MRTLKLVFILAIALCFQHTAKAQTAFKPLFTAIMVENIDSSVSWYGKVLNLKQRNRVDNAARGFKQVIMQDKGIMIELVQLDKAVSGDSILSTYPRGSALMGFYKFGMMVSNIDAVFQQLHAMAVNVHGKMVSDPVSGKKTFIIADPDGNLIQFFEE